ncbi:MAG: replicative DNA helicase [Prevotellaceae bacterium]|jgi:replicative DNA helicase|nr:replicative DNA helicase [Prevotellaceae bacterium]
MMKKPMKNQKPHISPTDIAGIETGKMPPHSNELERALLGALLLERDAIDEVRNILEPECFYNRNHEVIYRAILRLNEQREPIDLFTVADALKRTNELDEIGGNNCLSKLTLEVGSAAHVKYHAQVIFEKYILRRFIQTGHQIFEAGFNEFVDVDETLSIVEQEINKIAMQIAGKMDISHVRQVLPAALDEAYRRIENIRTGKCSGVCSGLIDLDKITNGWQKSNLVILAARPAMGKTAMMLHFAKSAAKAGHASVIFSLEMSNTSLTNRLILSESDILPDRFRSGYMSNDDIVQMERAAGIIEKLPIYIDDNSDVPMGRIRALARALHKQKKCDIVFIDYLQLCREKGTDNRNREQEVSAMSREAKILAKELDVPVILLSQLSRDVEKRQKNGVPQLSDLRDSGAIEQDADIVIFVYRPAYYGVQVEDKHGNQVNTENYGELLVEKHRDGACGRVKFRHNVGMTRIMNYGTCDSSTQDISVSNNFNNVPF